jgi:hypothetical protein
MNCASSHLRKWGNKVVAHGREWKTVFGQLLAQFIEHNVFPDDIRNVLLQSLHNPLHPVVRRSLAANIASLRCKKRTCLCLWKMCLPAPCFKP